VQALKGQLGAHDGFIQVEGQHQGLDCVFCQLSIGRRRQQCEVEVVCSKACLSTPASNTITALAIILAFVTMFHLGYILLMLSLLQVASAVWQ
jgi:hypothetical protein